MFGIGKTTLALHVGLWLIGKEHDPTVLPGTTGSDGFDLPDKVFWYTFGRHFPRSDPGEPDGEKQAAFEAAVLEKLRTFYQELTTYNKV